MKIYLLGRESIVRLTGKASSAYLEAVRLVPLGFKIVSRVEYLARRRELMKAGVIAVNKRGVQRVEQLERSQS